MIRISVGSELRLLAGSEELRIEPVRPYDDSTLEFLDELSKKLLTSGGAYPDAIAFAFWCRRASIQKLAKEFNEPRARLGLGLAFHITPSNVPINFAFSFAFGLLAGNANVVRVPSKDFGHIPLICGAIGELFEDTRFAAIRDRTAFVRYDRNDAVTTFFSERSHARVIWGGDETVRHIRSLPSMSRTVDIAFADRFSLCVLDAPGILALSDNDVKALAHHFYNDTYLMDQNACSSPHLVIWQGGEKDAARRRFWAAVAETARSKYDFTPIQAVDKYTLFCENLIDGAHPSQLTIDNKYVYRARLGESPTATDHIRGTFGLFYEHDVDSVLEDDVLKNIADAKCQTLTYFGVDEAALVNYVVDHHLTGVDRIVPVGKALDIGVYWDGFDIVRSLSRVIFRYRDIPTSPRI